MKQSLARLLRAPLFTLTASASLALAVGANTAIFSIANVLWLRPLPVRDAATLVVPYYPVVHSADGELLEDFSLPQALALRSLSTFESTTFQLNAGGRSADWRPLVRNAADGVPIVATAVAANYFSVLGVEVRGRGFRPNDDAAGAAPVAIITERLARRLSTDPSFAANRTIVTTRGPLPVIGIVSGGFHGPRLGDHIDLWITVGALGAFSDMAVDPGMRRLTPVTVFARLRSLSDLPAAEAEARTILHRRTTLRSLRDVAFPIHSEGGLVRQRDLVRTLWWAAVLVLLLGAMNLAALFLGRNAQLRQQRAIRLSLGSSRRSLAGDVLTEVAAISLAGLAAGLLVRTWLLRSVIASLEATSGLPIDALDVSLDSTTLVFGAFVTVASASVAAGAAVRQALRTDLSVLLVSTSAKGNRREGLARQVFLAAHVAVSIMLLSAAIGLVATVHAALTVDLGFARDRTVLASVRPRLTQYVRREDESRARADAYQDVIARLAALPFVKAAAYGDPPFDPNREPYESEVVVDGQARRLRPILVRAGPAYLAAAGVSLAEGRDLTVADTRHIPTQLEIMRSRSRAARARHVDGSPPRMRSGAIVDRALASMMWPGTSALGRELTWQGMTYEIMGVIERFGPLSNAGRPVPTLIVPAPIREYDGTRTLHVVVHVADAPGPHIAEITSILRDFFPDAPRLEVRSAIDALASTVAQERTGARIFVWYAVTATALGLVGIYGLLSFFIARAERELGIRSALGASISSMVRLMGARVLAPVMTGVLLGIVLSAGMERAVGATVVGLQGAPPASQAAAAALFLTAALTVIALGSRRLRGVNPIEILRAE